MKSHLRQSTSLNEATIRALLYGNIKLRSDKKIPTASTSTVAILHQQMSPDDYADYFIEPKKKNSVFISLNRKKDSILAMVRQKSITSEQQNPKKYQKVTNNFDNNRYGPFQSL